MDDEHDKLLAQLDMSIYNVFISPKIEANTPIVNSPDLNITASKNEALTPDKLQGQNVPPYQG